jgi:uncharacterized protein YjbI with pentapeptide repeats
MRISATLGFWLTAGLLLHCSEVREINRNAAAACSEATNGAARGLESITRDNPLCDTQTLVAALTPGQTIEVPLKLSATEDISTCFVDDDGESHAASLWQDGREIFSVSADGACDVRNLAAGSYTLKLQHAERSIEANDPSPDQVFAHWEKAVLGITRGQTRIGVPLRKLRIQVNQCVNCDLRGIEWPKLRPLPGYSGYFVRGFRGNFSGADFSGSRCAFALCVLENGVEPADFRNAKFIGVKFDGTASLSSNGGIRFGSDHRSRFDGAVFAPGGVHFEREKLFALTGSFKGATFRGDQIAAFRTEGGVDFSDVVFENLTSLRPLGTGEIPYRGYENLRGTFDAPVLRLLLENRYLHTPGDPIRVRPGDSLGGLHLDGRIDRIQWLPRQARRAGFESTSFVGSRLTSLDFPCEEGISDFAGADFSSATLQDVNLSGCDLSAAKFNGASLTRVSMRSVNLADAAFRDVTVDDLDLTSGSFPSGVFTPKRGSVVSELNLTDARFGVAVVGTVFVGLNAYRANLSRADFSRSQFTDASFVEATLDEAQFVGVETILDNANLKGARALDANFDSASLRYATLDKARFSATKFANVKFDRASFESGEVCGGDVSGSNFSGASLRGTLMPVTSTPRKVDGKLRSCAAVAGRGDKSPATNKETTCPSGALGPCNVASDWIPQ